MSIDIVVPSVGESITEVEVGDWLKTEGDWVEKDASVVVIESEKATVEIPAPAAGKLVRILKAKGAKANVGEAIGQLDDAVKPSAPSAGDAKELPAPPPRSPPQ